MLKIGDKAPDFKLKDETGRKSVYPISKVKVVIYFYQR